MSEVDNGLGTMLETQVDTDVTTDVSTDTSTVDTSVDQNAGVDGSEVQQVDQADQQRQPGETAQAQPQNIGREVSKFVREMSELHPDKAQLLKQMKDAFFGHSSYKGHFETPELAQRARATFEAIGGEEGLSKLQESSEALRRIDEYAASGSKELIDNWAKDSPEGLVKAAPHALEQVQKLNPQAFSKMLQPFFIKELFQTGIGDVLSRLEWYADQVKNDGLSKELGSMRQWLNGLSETERQRQAQANNPQNSELDQERHRIAKESASIQSQKIVMEVQPHITSSVEQALKQYDKSNTLKGVARNEMIQAIIGEIDRTLMNDKVYQSNLAALKTKGDIVAIGKYIKASVDAIKGRAAREVWLRRAAPFQSQNQTQTQQPGQQRQQPGTQQKVQPTGTALPIPQKPKPEDIDWSRDPDRLLFISGRAYLKNGKFVTWKRGSVN